MASRVFSTEEVLSFVVDNDEPDYDDPHEPLVDGSDEEFEWLEEEMENAGGSNTIYKIK